MIRGKTLRATNLTGANAGASNFIDKNLRVLRILAVLSYADTPEPRPGPSNPVAGDRPQVTTGFLHLADEDILYGWHYQPQPR